MHYLTKDNFIKVHDMIIELLDDIINNNYAKNDNKNKYIYDITGALFYCLLTHELFFVSDLNNFVSLNEYGYIKMAKIIRNIIIYSNDDNFKKEYSEVFKKCKMFFNNPLYFKYVTKYLKLNNKKIFFQ